MDSLDEEVREDVEGAAHLLRRRITAGCASAPTPAPPPCPATSELPCRSLHQTIIHFASTAGC